jgi:hypothetical protein
LAARGATSRKSSHNWTRRPRVYIGILLKLFVYLLPFKSYSTFSIWLETPLWRSNFRGFGSFYPKMSCDINVTPKGTSLHQTASFEPLSVSVRRAVRSGRVPKKPEKKKKSTLDVIFHVCVGAPPRNRLRSFLAYSEISPT